MESDEVCTCSIPDKIITFLADMLEKPKEKITKEDFLFSNLGMESVEVLELAFMIEQEFGFQVEADSLWRLSDYILANDLFVDGVLTDQAKALIKRNLHSLPEDKIASIINPHDVLKHLMVNDVIMYVARRVSGTKS